MRDLLHAAADHAADHLEGQGDRPIGPASSSADLLGVLDVPLPEGPADPQGVLDDLVRDAAPGLTGFGSPRFFGWVIGGALPASLAADWMVGAWDQNAGGATIAPAVAAIEEVAGKWVVDVLGLPEATSFGFVTGCQMAHVTALAAARGEVLRRAGWDVERDGLPGAPRIRVLAGAERHVTVDRALRLLGLGTASVEEVEADASGAMDAGALRAALASVDGPCIVVAQAGNVNTGAVDPMPDVCAAAREAGAWVHVDGAFGLWAAARPRRRALVAGVEAADSWATDGHKWLNVPYDCGIALVADAAAHQRAMTAAAAYIADAAGAGAARDPLVFNSEFSRRARGVPVYAALRSLGRAGVAELVDRLCDCADRFAERLGAEPGVQVLAHALNQVLVRFGDDDEATDAVLGAVQREGTCFMSGTVWRGRHAMRISVSNWQTTLEDVDRSIEAVLAARDAVAPAPAAR
ncbi:MAG TPA: aminotransferase class V-fold PLP-dependent enzyme [Solirubrobacteraceae bacterium]|nr:aminotransferase class V-fold PLP-dependent enzyme [Solirubrobacteraceae bacterium]